MSGLHKFRVFLWESIESVVKQCTTAFFLLISEISTPAGLDRRTHSHANSSDWSLMKENARSKCWKIAAPQRVLSIVSEDGFIPLIELYGS